MGRPPEHLSGAHGALTALVGRHGCASRSRRTGYACAAARGAAHGRHAARRWPNCGQMVLRQPYRVGRIEVGWAMV